jgi:hypothetical protein
MNRRVFVAGLGASLFHHDCKRSGPASDRTRRLLPAEPGRRRTGYLSYIQTPEVPFHRRPAFSQSLGDLYARSGRLLAEALGDGDCIDDCID